MHNKHFAEVPKKRKKIQHCIICKRVQKNTLLHIDYQYQKRKDSPSKVNKQPKYPYNVQLLIFIQACLIETFQYTTFTQY